MPSHGIEYKLTHGPHQDPKSNKFCVQSGNDQRANWDLIMELES